MKTFKELKSGDPVYYISIDIRTGVITCKEYIFSCYTGLIQGNIHMSLFFKGDKEPVVRVDSTKSEQIFEFGRSVSTTEIIKYGYFADKDAVDVFLKAEIEQSLKYIKNLELAHVNIWNMDHTKESQPQDNSNSPDSDLIKKYKKGDLLYLIAFDAVVLCDGTGNIYFADGEELSLTQSYIKNIRFANKLEISDFFDIMRNKILYSQDKERMKKTLLKCGYEYDMFKRQIIKI